MGVNGEAAKLHELIRMISAESLQGIHVKFEFGELTVYDPATHTAQFTLPMVRDENDDMQTTGFLPVGTFFTGPGYGAQFPPPQDAQALIAFVDHRGFNPVAALFLFNSVETPPYPDGHTWGWIDAKNNEVKTTKDGATAGDGKGGARVVGAAYASVVAPLVELGSEGLSADQDVVRRKDLQLVIDALNALIGVFNAHTHPGVTAGGAVTAAPSTPGTRSNSAKASSAVAAKD